MDGLALTAVITSGVVGVSGVGVGVWTARQSASVAQRARIEQRRADAYIEVLKLAELEGLWNAAVVWNLQARAEEDYGPTRRMQVTQPELTNQATAEALLAVVGSVNARRAHQDWRGAVSAFQQEHERLAWNFEMAGDGEPTSREDLIPLADFLTAERIARSRLADVVALELGHR